MDEVIKTPQKMERNEQEHMILTDSTRLHDFWSLRDARMLLDRDIINLVPKQKQTTGMKIWQTAEPKVFFDTARSLVSLNNPRFKLPITIGYSPEEEDRMNKAERLCIGIYRSLDSRVADTGGNNWLYDLAYWLLGGWYAIFAIVKKGEDGVEFHADHFDPMTVYPEWNGNELVKVSRQYTVDKVTSETMARDFMEQGLEFDYKEPAEGLTYSVNNYWRKDGKKVWNAILLNGGIVKPLTLQRNLDRIPIHVGAVGIPDKISPNWQARWGENIIASARDNYDFITQMRSLRAEIVEETAYPNIVSKTRTGAAAVKGEDIKGHGSVIPLKLEDSIETLKHAATPQDVSLLESQIQMEIQKANLPNVVYGGITVETSGFAISQLLAAIKYKLGPYLNKMQFVTSTVMTDLLYQYQKGNFGKITLTTRNPYDMKRGKYYLEEFSKEDVPDHVYVEVEIPISSQYDKTQAILNSVQALQSKLMSRETLWENELDIQDAEQEKARIAEDEVAADPFIRQLEIIAKMYERVQVYEMMPEGSGKPMADALRKYILTLEANLGITRGAGTPPAQPGVTPSQRPVEATPASPDISNAATGTPPPSPNRPKGVIFSPDGQPIL